MVRRKEQRVEREKAAVRKGGYWICGVFPQVQ